MGWYLESLEIASEEIDFWRAALFDDNIGFDFDIDFDFDIAIAMVVSVDVDVDVDRRWFLEEDEKASHRLDATKPTDFISFFYSVFLLGCLRTDLIAFYTREDGDVELLMKRSFWRMIPTSWKSVGKKFLCQIFCWMVGQTQTATNENPNTSVFVSQKSK